ncbi:1-deoxy-D-xylulose-5-phosphate synthase [Treponema parvum]|uniref:1-deoxy-D-xylulose-5-phosphate synthase n=1 Tax=Treponema parvum TaxID=138851 RepID=UPI00211DF35A|nr:1-deoxy-D-xylulose-5-phosphate synthase [Treponema parvum]
MFYRSCSTILSSIHSPDDVKRLSKKELPILASEIRKEIIEVVGKNGGHLASNLGVVELTIALHRSFKSPSDAIVWDVSHQCYAHKLLTGRYAQFHTLRRHGGLSGFTKKKESPHDFFDSGHASTSISCALGLLTAWQHEGRDGKVVAVIGDGALTGGMAFEALSHAGLISKNLIVILNDNQMSINPNTGSLSRYLSRLTVTSSYQNFRHTVDHIVDKIPYFNKYLSKMIFRLKRGIKGMFLMNNLFVDLGFEYVGPLNGHDINELEKVFNHVKKLPRPVVIHVVTKKGKGFSPAENDPARFHGIGPLCLDEGKVEKIDTTSFTEAFGTAIVNLAETHPNIAAVTAAMTKGTGLETFARNFKNRFFDVGIAEQHAVTFGAGLAAGGMIPVICIYSTFIQRSIDQIIHDAALQKLHMIFVFDRAGVVPDDGETHQGLFDLALLRPIPNISIMTPAGAFDLEMCLTWAVDKAKTPVVIRYPKLSCPSDTDEFSNPIEEGKGIFIPCTSFAPTLAPAENAKVEKKVLLICTGGFYSETLSAARLLLMKDVVTDIYVLRFIKPIDTYDIWRVCKNYGAAVIAEDGVKTGGVGEYVENFLLKQGMKTVKVKAFPDCFLSQGTRSEICSDSGMSPEDIAAAALDCLLEGKK